MDNKVVDAERNFLFGEPGEGGVDLASANIQRERDHGLADYNAVRKANGLKSIKQFSDITSDSEIQDAVQDTYDSVDEIALWISDLAEDHVSGACG